MCTALTFQSIDGTIFFGRTLDFSISIQPALYIIPKHYRWSSVTNHKQYENNFRFIGIGQEINGFPAFIEGVNDQGLAVAALYFEGYADFQLASDEKEELTTFDFVHYLLGSCQSIKQVKEKLVNKRIIGIKDPITNTVAPLHWIATDREGNCVAIEQTYNGLQIIDNPIGVFANSPTFDWHLTNLPNYMNLTTTQKEEANWGKVTLKPFSQGGGTAHLPGGFTSPERFVRMAFLKSHIVTPENNEAAIVTGFQLLGNVFLPKGIVITPKGEYDFTRYVSMINTNTGEYYFKTYNNDQIMTASLHDFDTSKPEMICLGKLINED